jgi:hypothetical protein
VLHDFFVPAMMIRLTKRANFVLYRVATSRVAKM